MHEAIIIAGISMDFLLPKIAKWCKGNYVQLHKTPCGGRDFVNFKQTFALSVKFCLPYKGTFIHRTPKC